MQGFWRLFFMFHNIKFVCQDISKLTNFAVALQKEIIQSYILTLPMNTNKYEGTMFSHCNSELTDRMLEADSLVKKVEYLQEHLDNDTLESHIEMLKELDRELVSRCVNSRFKLTHETFGNSKDQFMSLLFHLKHVSREIYTAWLAGIKGSTPVFSQCVQEIDNKISRDDAFGRVLNRM